MTASHAGWINQIIPLYIAGLAFDTEVPDDCEEYALEKFALLKHLVESERKTS